MIKLLLTAAICGASVILSADWPVCRFIALIGLAFLTVQAAAFYRDSRTDPLTGLYNLLHLKDRSRFYGHCRVLRVWYFDLDHLKQTNDAIGHAAGDERLKDFAALLRAVPGKDTRAYRLGGDEFLLIIPGTDTDPPPPLPGNRELSASWGYAQGSGSRLDSLIHSAEQQMYRSRLRRTDAPDPHSPPNP